MIDNAARRMTGDLHAWADRRPDWLALDAHHSLRRFVARLDAMPGLVARHEARRAWNALDQLATGARDPNRVARELREAASVADATAGRA